MDKLLFFSNNKNKLKEVKNIFQNSSIKIFSQADFKINYEPKEFGSSFAENAKIKSAYGYKILGLPCFADDSGICIEALNWSPGIFSKKFISKFKNNSECFDYIIDKVKESGKRKAYFKTSICLTIKHNYHISFEGIINGLISNNARGGNGFGYDPIFIPDGIPKTLSEISRRKKNAISHRSIAIKKLLNFLSN